MKIVIALLISFIFVLPVQAQEVDFTRSITTTHATTTSIAQLMSTPIPTVPIATPIIPTPAPTAQNQTYTRTLIVQTDLEEPVANHTVVCRQTPKKLGPITNAETTVHEITTNDSGEAVLEFKQLQESVFTCSSKELTTQDYCWYFPYSTASFEIYEESAKNKPVYLVGQTSPNTCDRELTPEELKNGIGTLLPQGTAIPFTNKNLLPDNTLDSGAQAADAQTDVQADDQAISLWQWIVQKLKALFW